MWSQPSDEELSYRGEAIPLGGWIIPPVVEVPGSFRQ